MGCGTPEGMDTTDLFLALTPERILDAVEAAGLRCNPVAFPLNSYENRVYDVQLEDRTHIVAKFYRPKRWSEAQIREEHRFLAELHEAEVPVCAARHFPGGDTLRCIDGIWYAIYDRQGGRAPEEVDEELAERLGMLVARIHAVGAAGEAPSRATMGADVWIRDSLRLLRGLVPPAMWGRYEAAASALAAMADERLRGVAMHRVHGDFHLGNLLLRDGVLHVLDFDDLVTGPAAQDLWMALSGAGTYVVEAFIEGYERFRAFDRRQLTLFTPLRAMRRVSYAAWLARRWHDPIFPATWPHFGTEAYWEAETADLEGLLREEDAPSAAAVAVPEELTNADLFWDWEEPKG